MRRPDELEEEIRSKTAELEGLKARYLRAAGWEERVFCGQWLWTRVIRGERVYTTEATATALTEMGYAG